MTEFETLVVAVNAGVASVMLNRPEALNAMNHRMADELDQVVADSTIRAVILHGSGGAFCAG